MTLSEFLVAAAQRRFRYGEADCLTWMLPWVRARRGVDPSAGLVYATKIGALRLIRRAGGMAGLLDSLFAPLGIVMTEDPQSGDVAVVMAPEGEMGAIVLKPLTVCFAGPGLFIRPLPILKAWRI